MRKTTFFTLAFSFLLVLPATAQLGKVWTDFQNYSVDLQNYLRYNLSDTLRPLETRSQNALSGSTGELNVPNPVGAVKQLNDDIVLNSISDKFENNSAVRATSISNEINRLLTRGAVVSIMGRDGQLRLKAKLQDTQTILETNDKLVTQAEQNNQNLLRQLLEPIPGANAVVDQAAQRVAQTSASEINLQLQMLKIQSSQTKITSETLAQTVQSNQSLQYSNLNLANISQQMEEANRARRVDTATEAARLLRTTSQIDLFGRKAEN